MISLAHPHYDRRVAAEAVSALVESGRPGQGEIIQRFEERFADYVGAKHAIACGSGTLALSVALAALKSITPRRTEVIVPALTFPATVNAVIHAGLEPVFVDVGEDMQIDISLVQSAASRFTLCVLPVHLLGWPAQVQPLLSQYTVGEDACEALGTTSGDKYAGTVGAFGCFSFFPTHTMTSGEGGMIVTSLDEFAARCRVIRDHGKRGDPANPEYVGLGFNGKMNQMEAAVGLASLECLDQEIAARRRVAAALIDIPEGVVPHGVPFRFESRQERDAALKRLAKAGVEARAMFPRLTSLPHLSHYASIDMGIAEWLSGTVLYAPCHSGMTDEGIETIRQCVGEAIGV